MTNIYSTDSDEEAIVDIVMGSFMAVPTRSSGTRPGWITCGKDLRGATTSQSEYTRLGSNAKGLNMENLTQSKSGQATREMMERQN